MSFFKQQRSHTFVALAISIAVLGWNMGCGSSDDVSTGPSVDGIEVPEGFTVEKVADSSLVEYPMFASLDKRGRLFISESIGNTYQSNQDAINNPRFRINMLEDVDSDGVYDKNTIFADSLPYPQGAVYHDGSLIVSAAPDLLRLTDTDDDGVADEREVLLTGWNLFINANSMIGPFMGPDGWLYMTSSIVGFDITTQEGERLTGTTARIWRARPDGSDLQWVSAGGMNNPVEVAFTQAGELIGTETYFTDPKAGQRDALVHWVEGGVYPKPNSNIQDDDLPRTGPLMHVVHKYPRVSPSGITRYPDTELGAEDDPFQGNFFSARFNTHQVLRHIPSRKGATFETKDEIFFKSEDVNFHPTDVLPDADGSLLIVETGGWFIKGCPLSQVSTDREGAIYRVRREGAREVDDPYGKQISFASLSPEELTSYLDDPRPVVRERALDQLVAAGAPAVGPLGSELENSEAADVRTAAVFGLYRIGTSQALETLRPGLRDASLQVRVAAARSVGLARDSGALDRLAEMVKNDEPAARRQAATALGRIGSRRAVPALLSAAKNPDDRFVEHAIIYALISIGDPQPLDQALTRADPDVQEAALIALDQMEGSPLQPEDLRPFLGNEQQKLHQTGLWVASHHPEWSGVVIDFLGSRLRGEAFSEEEAVSVRETLTAFCGSEDVQNLVARLLGDPSLRTGRKTYLLDAIGQCDVEEFPSEWTAQVGTLLEASDAELRAKAVETVRLRGITQFTTRLSRIVEGESEPSVLRVAAAGALAMSRPELSDDHFAFLYRQLSSAENDAPLRKSVLEVLSQATLTEEQLHKLAFDFLPEADSFILVQLLDVFKQGSSDPEVGEAVASALMNDPQALGGLTRQEVQELFTSYPDSMENATDQLMAQLETVEAERLGRLQELEKLTGGSIAEGRALYFGKATCYTCHTVGGEGGDVGPDLSSIGEVRSRHDLLEAIAYPSVSIVREYETYEVQTNTQTYRGIIEERTPEVVVLQTGPDVRRRIPRDEITSLQQVSQSMMPSGLDRVLTKEEMADLMAFLMGQDQRPEQDEELLR